MTAIRSRFFDCPSEDLKMKALTIIAMEARSAPSMKRKKMNNIRAATKAKKRKPSYKQPAEKTKTPAKKRRSSDRSDSNTGSGAIPKELADLSLD